MQNIPEKFHSFLGPYEVQVVDPTCGEVVGYGHKILEKLGEELWQELGQYGKLTYVMPDRKTPPFWALLTKTVTREELLAKHGPVTEEVFGPRGGWKSVTFGNVKYTAKELKTAKETLPSTHPVVVAK